MFLFCFLGASELAVQKAKTEITRLIKEELIRLVCVVTDEMSLVEYTQVTLGVLNSLKCVIVSFFLFAFSKIPTSRQAKAATKCCRGSGEDNPISRLSRQFHQSG